MLALFGQKPRVEHQGPLEVRVFPVNHPEFRWGIPASPATWPALAGFDIYHLMVFPTMASDALSLLARRTRGLVLLTDVGGGGRSWSGYFDTRCPRLAPMRWAHGLAHLSAHASTFFADWPQPSTVLYGGANLRELDPGTRRFEGYALFVGRLLPHKGLLPLVQCLSPEVPLRVVGRPYDLDYLESVRDAAKGKAITFHLEADDRELSEHYAGANVVLQPTLPDRLSAQDRSELLGLVAIEGMAAGKPVIVTRCTSLPELVEDGRTGYVMEPGDGSLLARRVEQLVKDSSLAERMGAEARRRVEARFTWDLVARRALAFYAHLGTLHRKKWNDGLRAGLGEEGLG